MIVVVFGLPGSGKSFFASRLALEIKGTYVNSDQLRMQLFKKRNYTEDEKKHVYDRMFELVLDALEKNTNLVVDATFYKKELREPYLSIDEKGKIYWIEVTATTNTIKQRLSRPRAFSEADYNVHKKVKTEWDHFTQDHLILESTDTNIEDMLTKAKSYLALV